jgi:hypothetical protein
LEFPTDKDSIAETNLEGFHWDLSKTGDQLPYPLYAGPVISETIYRYSLKLPIDPWLWWIGQFVTYAMRLKDSTRKQIEKDQDRIGFKPNDCIG